MKSNCEASAWLILDMKYPLMLEKSPRDRAGDNWAGVDIPVVLKDFMSSLV